MRKIRCTVMALLLASACSPATSTRGTETARSVSEKRALPPRDKLPLAAREMLTTRMDRHGDRMILLMESVVLLNYHLTQVLAEEIVAEPKLGRPAPGEKGTLNALLPAAFFNYQDQLSERARTLVVAAQSESHEKMMAAYVGVAESCVGCHAAYLYEDDELSGDEDALLHAPGQEPLEEAHDHD